jgi:GxxExxY protein
MGTLGKGHRESVYRRALSTALNNKHICHRTHVDCPIIFMGECVGVGQADLVVEDLVIELKVLQKVPTGASDQLCKYIDSLERTEASPFRGVVINFNSQSGMVDIVEELPPSSARRTQRQTTPKKRRVTSPYFKQEEEQEEAPWVVHPWASRVTRSRSARSQPDADEIL